MIERLLYLTAGCGRSGATSRWQCSSSCAKAALTVGGTVSDLTTAISS